MLWRTVVKILSFFWWLLKTLFVIGALVLCGAAVVEGVQNIAPNERAANAIIGLAVVAVAVVIGLFAMAEGITKWKAAAASGHNASTTPGTYLGWPMPMLLILIVLGCIPPFGLSEGNVAAFAVTAVLNPVLWAAIVPFWYMGRMRCPHCRKASSMSAVGNMAVGSLLQCPLCNNVASKPVG